MPHQRITVKDIRSATDRLKQILSGEDVIPIGLLWELWSEMLKVSQAQKKKKS